MYTKTLTTFEEQSIEISIPENANEITIGQLMAVTDPNLTDFEIMAEISGLPVEDLYEMFDIDLISDFVKSYQAVVDFLVNRLPRSLAIPAALKITYQGRGIKVKVRGKLNIEPAGCYFMAKKLIDDEIQFAIDMFGPNSWQDHFSPSITSCSRLLDLFLFRKVDRSQRSLDETIKCFEGISKQLPLIDALAIAKHFFNKCPDLNEYSPKYCKVLQGN